MALEPSAKPRARCFTTLLTLLSISSIGLLIFNIIAFPIVFQDLVNTQVVLKNGTLSFTQWINPTPKIYKIVTVYNVTNTVEVAVGGQPIIDPIGPYYFREYREKIDVGVVYDQEVWFSEKKYYIFDNETTNKDRPANATLDPTKDKFTTFNLAYIGVAYNLTCSGAPSTEILEAVIAALAEHEEALFMSNHTVQEVLFGYKDPFLTVLRVKMPDLPDTVQIVYNMSDQDITTRSKVWNGQKDVSLLGQYSEWQGYTSLPWWGSAEANTVNGTEGLFFAPNVDKTKTLTTWTDDLFRSSQMEFVEEEMMLGMNTYKYHIPKFALLNATNNPLNAGFYSFCPNGLMNLTAAVSAPVFASKPSFMDGEPWLLEEVTGLPPADLATMDTNIWVEPTTGALVKAIKQLQVNVMIQQTKKFPKLDKLRIEPRYVPVALVLETGGMDDDLATTFKDSVFKPRRIFVIIIWVLLGLVVALSVLFGGLLFRHIRVNQSEDSTKLIIPANPEDQIYANN